MSEHRVIGPPGTGKTTYLTRQCKTAAGLYGASGIALASLTRAAAKEIASRSTGVPTQNIGTLHAHAFRRMSRPSLCETSEGMREWNERCGIPAWRLTHRSVANPESGSALEDMSAGDGGDGILSEIGVFRAQMRDERLWPQRVKGFWKRWCQWKDDTGRMDFTDLIERAIEDVPDLGVDVLMLDEAQDMSRLEMELARKWGAECRELVVCGDPDQNLYEWRGSDPEAFYAADAATTRVLAQSYRVPRAVHAAAVQWIDQLAGRRPVEYFPTVESGRVVRHQQLCAQDGAGVSRLVQQLSEDGSSVMVLASCGYQLQPLLSELRAAGVPFHNPYRLTQGAWNPLTYAKRLLAFLRPDADAYGSEARMWTWAEMWQWVDVMNAKGVLPRGMEAYIENRARGGRFDNEEDGIIAGLSDVLDCFEDRHWDRVHAVDMDWWYNNLKHADQKRQLYPCTVARSKGSAALREVPQVIVGTIHSVKGGEADKVVLSPDLSRAGIEEWEINRRAPIVRMMYVGMTRARKELHLMGASTQNAVAL